MPRTARASVGGIWYHALNRGNRGDEVFHKPADYENFVEAMVDARERLPVDVLGYCLMANHFHLIIRPNGDDDLGRWMQSVLTAHARRYNRDYATTGHVWQGRFKSFPVQDDEHLATLLRYVEHNPRRAKLVKRAEKWKWCSLPGWVNRDPFLYRGKPSVRGRNWLERVNAPLPAGELERIRHAVARGCPFGDPEWTMATARRLGLESSLRPIGRPRKTAP